MHFDETTFSYSISELSDTVLKVEILGALNEDANLMDVIDEVLEMRGSYRSLILELLRVSSINSCGIRAWLLFIERIQAIMPCKLGVLSHVFVDQANTVSNMTGKPALSVFAFEAPYHCTKCNAEVMKVLETAKIQKDQGVFKAPPQVCAKCNLPMEFDAFEEEYFSFLKRVG